VPFVPSWSLPEAMSMQATVVASDVAPVREVVTNGRTGFLVDFFSPQELAAKVVDVLGHPTNYREIGKAARQHIVETYDFHQVCLRKHVRVINKLLPKQLRMPVC
jgi:glycosyltransferase involved in cell wall biosynthesis